MPENNRSKSAPPAQASITIMPDGRELKIQLRVPPMPKEAPEPRFVTIARRLADIAIGGPKTLRHLADMVRAYLPSMAPEQRLDLFATLMRGYCQKCGGPAPCSCRGALIVATAMPDGK